MGDEDPSTLSEGVKKSIAPNEKDVFDNICKFLKKWDDKAYRLRILHVLLIIIATVSSVYVATTVDSNSFLATSGTTAIAALIAAVSSALFAGLDLGTKSNNVRTAWRRLNAAVMKYRVGDILIEDLIECYERCEELIGDVRASVENQ